MVRTRSLLLLSSTALALLLTPAFAKKKAPAPAPAPAAAPANDAANSLTTTIQGDQKDIDADRIALTKANKDLNDATEQSAAVVAAKKAVADATAQLGIATDAVKGKLASDPTYKAATAKEAAARSQLDDLRNSGAEQDAIAAKATEVFEDGGVTSKLERDAEALDPKCIAAQKSLTDANTALAAARTAAKNDPAVAALKQAHDDAQTKLTAALAKLDADRKGTATASGK